MTWESEKVSALYAGDTPPSVASSISKVPDAEQFRELSRVHFLSCAVRGTARGEC
jgi:hypothetical protein